MKNETPGNSEPLDPLDELLRSSEDYLPDNGFTARVMASLPARQSHSWLRLALLSSALLIGGAIVAFQWPSLAAILWEMPRHLERFQWESLLLLVPILAALGSMIWITYAIVTEEE